LRNHQKSYINKDPTMRFDITILGSNSAIPAFGRFLSSQVLAVHNNLYLIDCGEGTQFRIRDFKIKASKIDQIFISHLHGDHYLGLVGLLGSLNLAGRQEPLTIFSPHGLREIVEAHIKYGETRFGYELKFEVVNTLQYQKIFEDNRIEVYSIPLKHRIPTTGYLFKEKPHPKNINVDAIKKYDLSIQQIKDAKSGIDLFTTDGTLVPNEELTSLKKRRSFAYCSDTLYTESIIPFVQNVDILYHEATYLDNLRKSAKQYMHSTAFQAATIAQKANVGKLLLGHFSSRYDSTESLQKEARTIFKHSFAVKEGKSYTYEDN